MKNFQINNVIFDVDGVLTDGTFFYSIDGKIMKRFGSHDAQAIKKCRTFFNLQLIIFYSFFLPKQLNFKFI